jgi:hypothetical protein
MKVIKSQYLFLMKISLYVKIAPMIETFFLENWLQHNLNLGIDEIFIYNNGFELHDDRYLDKKSKWQKKLDSIYSELPSQKEVSDKLYDLVSDCPNAHLVSWEFNKDHTDSHVKSQVNGYKHCTSTNSSDYWLHCDVDEYFILNAHSTFNEFILDEHHVDVGSFWFGSEHYGSRKVDKPISEIESTGNFKKSRGNWKFTGCNTKCLVKSPIFWTHKHDSVIHKNRSHLGSCLHIDLNTAYFKHYGPHTG